MKTLLKKSCALLLTVAMVCSMCGCSDSGESTKTDKKESKTVTADSSGGSEKEGPWTILVYLCGTDLESQNGAATMDLSEMISTPTGDDCKFVVQTGGCSGWQNEAIANDKTQRFEVQNQDIKEVYSSELMNMGDAGTLQDFVKWGVDNYGGGKLGLIFWDHGGGSMQGVCMDEVAGDSLSLKEIDQALSVTDRKFEFVGFDACLMSTVETATMLSKHALYMVASEETECGMGWNYTSFTEALNKKSDISTEELGKVICDGFVESSKQADDEDNCTLSVTNLSKISKVVETFDAVAAQMSESLTDIKAFGNVSKNIMRAESYGANSPTEGYTNMIDLGNMAERISKTVDTSALLAAIDDAVVYQVKGKNRSHAHGLSVYYPLEFSETSELDKAEEISISQNYFYFICGVIYGSLNGSIEGYVDEESVPSTEGNGGQDGFTGSDKVNIKIADELHLNDDGYYTFTIDKGSLDNVSMVNYNLYMDIDGEGNLIYLGSDDNVAYDEKTGVVEDVFEGYWPTLNGVFLTMYVVEQTDEHTIFSSPVIYNGKETNLRFMYTLDDEKWTVLGVWDGVDENGQAAREVQEIKKGDTICPKYIGINAETKETAETEGETIKIKNKLEITEELLPKGDYYYTFSIDDIFGSTMYLDMVKFNVDKKGNITTD